MYDPQYKDLFMQYQPGESVLPPARLYRVRVCVIVCVSVSPVYLLLHLFPLVSFAFNCAFSVTGNPGNVAPGTIYNENAGSPGDGLNQFFWNYRCLRGCVHPGECIVMRMLCLCPQ